MTPPTLPPAPDREALADFRANASRITEAAVRNATIVRDTLSEPGRDAVGVVGSGMAMTHSVLAGILAAPSVQLIEDQLNWAKTRLPHDGVGVGTMIAGLRAMRVAVEECLTATSARQISPFVSWMIERLGGGPSAGVADGE